MTRASDKSALRRGVSEQDVRAVLEQRVERELQVLRGAEVDQPDSVRGSYAAIDGGALTRLEAERSALVDGTLDMLRAAASFVRDERHRLHVMLRAAETFPLGAPGLRPGNGSTEIVFPFLLGSRAFAVVVETPRAALVRELATVSRIRFTWEPLARVAARQGPPEARAMLAAVGRVAEPLLQSNDAETLNRTGYELAGEAVGNDALRALAVLTWIGGWPGDVAPGHLATWIADGAKRLPSGVDTFEVSVDGDGPSIATSLADGSVSADALRLTATRFYLSGAQLAHVFSAERALENDRRRPRLYVDAGDTHHALIATWSESARAVNTPKHRHHEGRELSVVEGARLELLRPGRPAQLGLPFDGAPSEQIIRTIQRALGPDGLRNWTAILALLSDAGRQGYVRWTVRDHLLAMGLSETSRARLDVQRSAAEMVELFTRMELAVYDRTGTLRRRAPLLQALERTERIAESQWQLDGMTLQLNPVLYAGVRAPDGSVGTLYWPAPRSLASIDATRFPGAIPLGLLLSIRLRWDLASGKSQLVLSGESVLGLAGIKFNPRKPGEGWKRLERALTELERREALCYSWRAGEEWTLQGMLEFRPTRWQLEHWHGVTPVELPRELQPLPSGEHGERGIPITGADLAAWRKVNGWTQDRLAAALGVSVRTLRNAESKGAAALPPSVRKALERERQALTASS